MLIFNIDFNENNLPLKKIIQFAETHAVTENIAKEYIVTLLLQDRNVLSQICEEKVAVGNSLRTAALKDIERLMEKTLPEADFLKSYVPSVKRKLPFGEYQQSLESIVTTNTYEKMLDKIISHYSLFGGGKVSKYIAFKWDKGLQGIKTPDDITLNQLFCLEAQKQELIGNTKSFLQDLPANNVLLYGNSGCGKSSMVKAVLNEYYQDGLRLVQISKDDLTELPLLINEIKEKNFYYIIYLDDLSFENDDLGYKTLKTILEGGIEKQPENILFYATSNRFHLVNETWSERQGDEVHANDTKNEKLSLSERFGIRISFMSPDQNKYLKIIEGILSQKGISVTAEIKAEAVKWALHCNGMSGRTAIQFANAVFSNKAGMKA